MMRLLSRCTVGALALLLLALAVPESASAAKGGGGRFQAGAASGGSYAKSPAADGYRWRERPVERPGFPGVRVPCDGSEPEAKDGTIPKGLYNHVLDRSATEGFVAHFFRKYETYQQLRVAPFSERAGSGRDHCKLDLDVQWNRVNATLVQRSGLAGTWMRQDVALEAQAIVLLVPSYDDNSEWWFRGTATAESTQWRSPGDVCPLRNPTTTSVEMQFTKKACPLEVAVTWSFGAERGSSPEGPWEPIAAGEGQTLTLESMATAYPMTVNGVEARISYTDGSTTASNGATTRESVEVIRSREASEGFQTKVVDPRTGELVEFTAVGVERELDAQGRPIVTAADTDADADANANANAARGTTPSNPSSDVNVKKASSGNASNSQSRLFTIGGFGFGLVFLAMAAASGLLYFGRRHRL